MTRPSRHLIRPSNAQSIGRPSAAALRLQHEEQNKHAGKDNRTHICHPKASRRKARLILGPVGVEPTTSSLSATRSDQLSYEPDRVIDRVQQPTRLRTERPHCLRTKTAPGSNLGAVPPHRLPAKIGDKKSHRRLPVTIDDSIVPQNSGHAIENTRLSILLASRCLRRLSRTTERTADQR